MQRRSGSAFWLVFTALCLVLLLVSMDLQLGPFDEGFMLYGADRLAHGALLYRDVWALYGPGEFLLIAALFKLLGTTAIAGRLAYIVSMMVFLLLSARLGLWLHGRRACVVAVAAVCILWIAGVKPSLVYPIFPSLALALLTVVLLALRWKRNNARYALAAGASAAVLLLFRHDIAAWTTLALLFGDLYFHLAIAPTRSAAVKALLRDILLFLGGFAPVSALAWLLILRHVPLADIYDQLFFYQAHIYKAVRGLPFPSPWYWGPVQPPPAFVVHHHLERLNRLRVLMGLSAIYLPFLVLFASALSFVRGSWRRSLPPWQAAMVLSLIAIVAATPVSGLVRPDLTHQVLGVLPAILLLSILLAVEGRLAAPARWSVRVACVAAVLFCGGTLLRGVAMAAGNARSAMSRRDPGSPWQLCRAHAGLERARCLSLEPDAAETVLYIDRHTSPGDHIFASGTRTDIIYNNDTSLYFLTARDAPGKWAEFEPGVGNTVPVQQVLVARFDSDRVKYVVQDTRNDSHDEPNLSSVSSGVFLLDRYIAANYRIAARFGSKTVLERVSPFPAR